MSTTTVGVVGSKGDLGSILTDKLLDSGCTVLGNDISDPNSASIEELVQHCSIIHIAAPLENIEPMSFGKQVILVLHDSVMSTSQAYNQSKFDGRADIVHMLMNQANSVVIAVTTPHLEEVRAHVIGLGFTPHIMSIDEHDRLMAQSQAPFALLLKSLHEPLKEQCERGLLTPSGELLMRTLDARELEWTPETVHSILKNPQLHVLMQTMQAALVE